MMTTGVMIFRGTLESTMQLEVSVHTHTQTHTLVIQKRQLSSAEPCLWLSCGLLASPGSVHGLTVRGRSKEEPISSQNTWTCTQAGLLQSGHDVTHPSWMVLATTSRSWLSKRLTLGTSRMKR